MRGRRKMVIIGYARTSTAEQKAGMDAQIRDLEAAGVERMYREHVSSVDMVARAIFADAMSYSRPGDVLVVTKLDRLARSVAHLMQIVEELTRKGVALRILDLGVDTGTPTGKLMLTLLGGIAEFERSIMLERQREGIAKAQREGKYKGRAPTARAKTDEVLALRAAGMGPTAIAIRLKIGRQSVYRILADAPQKPQDGRKASASPT